MPSFRTIAMTAVLFFGALGVYGMSLDPPHFLTSIAYWFVDDGEQGSHKEALW